MKAEQIIDMIGEIDEELIQETAAVRVPKRRKFRIPVPFFFLTAAAAILLLFIPVMNSFRSMSNAAAPMAVEEKAAEEEAQILYLSPFAEKTVSAVTPAEDIDAEADIMPVYGYASADDRSESVPASGTMNNPAEVIEDTATEAMTDDENMPVIGSFPLISAQEAFADIAPAEDFEQIILVYEWNEGVYLPCYKGYLKEDSHYRMITVPAIDPSFWQYK